MKLIVVLVVIAGASSQIRDEHLVSVYNVPGNDGGRSTRITIFGNQAFPSPNRNEFPSKNTGALSPLCHSDCIANMKLASGVKQNFVVIYLLESGIVLQWFEYDSYTLMPQQDMVFHPTPYCTPSQLIKSCNSYIIVCVSEGESILEFYELTLTNSTNSELVYTAHTNLINDLASLSNIILVDCETATVVFVDGSKIVENEIERRFLLSHDVSCDRVSNLQQVNDTLFLLYCSNGSTIFFDLRDGEEVSISSTIRPYLCPLDRDTFVEVVSSPSSPHIRYGRHSLHTSNTLGYQGTLHWGECFGEEDTGGPFFAFQDDSGVTVINTLTAMPMFGGSSCRQPAVFDERYIVVWQCSEEEEEEEEETVLYRRVSVHDSLKNFEIVITGEHVQAKVATLVYDITAMSNPPIEKETGFQWIPIAAVLPAVMLFAVGVAVIAGVLLYKRRPTGRRENYELPRIEQGGEELETEPTPDQSQTEQTTVSDLPSSSPPPSRIDTREEPEGGDQDPTPQPIDCTDSTHSRTLHNRSLVMEQDPSFSHSNQLLTVQGVSNPVCSNSSSRSSESRQSPSELTMLAGTPHDENPNWVMATNGQL